MMLWEHFVPQRITALTTAHLTRPEAKHVTAETLKPAPAEFGLPLFVRAAALAEYAIPPAALPVETAHANQARPVQTAKPIVVRATWEAEALPAGEPLAAALQAPLRLQHPHLARLQHLKRYWRKHSSTIRQKNKSITVLWGLE